MFGKNKSLILVVICVFYCSGGESVPKYKFVGAWTLIPETKTLKICDLFYIPVCFTPSALDNFVLRFSFNTQCAHVTDCFYF